MGDLKFEEFGDIWIFLLTVPGHLFNMVFGLAKFLVISLPITLFHFAMWLCNTAIGLPETLFKAARILVGAGWGLIKNLYLFVVTNDWNWNSLNDFPSLTTEFRVLLNLGGINQPFDYFAGSYSFAVKEFILPLRRAMNDLRDFIDFMPWPIFFALVLLLRASRACVRSYKGMRPLSGCPGAWASSSSTAVRGAGSAREAVRGASPAGCPTCEGREADSAAGEGDGATFNVGESFPGFWLSTSPNRYGPRSDSTTPQTHTAMDAS